MGWQDPPAYPEFRLGYLPEAVAVDPTGRFVYVANRGSSDVSMFAVDATSRTLRLLQPERVKTGGEPQSIAVDPTGRFAYVANFSSEANSVGMYRIEMTSGQLIPQADAPAGQGPISVAIDPTSQFVYVANYYTNTLLLDSRVLCSRAVREG